MQLFRDNKIAKKYELTAKELADQFLESSFYKDFVEMSPLLRSVRSFIESENGLNSVIGSESVKELEEVEKLLINKVRKDERSRRIRAKAKKE